jgi:hypothetical protein
LVVRRYLDRDTRHVFNQAWKAVPSSAKSVLEKTVKTVRSIDHDLSGTASFRRRDGLVIVSVDPFSGWCGYDLTDNPPEAHIWLSRIVQTDLGFGIATVLHELAHALDLADRAWEATREDDGQREWHAWLQAAAWASRLAVRGNVYAYAVEQSTDFAKTSYTSGFLPADEERAAEQVKAMLQSVASSIDS